jgi:hypothetical protein
MVEPIILQLSFLQKWLKESESCCVCRGFECEGEPSMKKFKGSKLNQALAAFLLLAVAIVIPLSGTMLHSHAAPSSSQGSWTIVPSPNVGTDNNVLSAIATVSSSNKWAVGYHNNTTTNSEEMLIEHWDGSSWNIVSGPNVGTGYNTLSGITAISGNDIWAVGNATDPTSGTLQPLTIHWDGSSWSIVSSSNPISSSGSQVYLSAVTAIATNDVWAVGYFIISGGSGSVGSFAMHWDGSSWNTVSTPGAPFAYANFFYSVTAVSSNDVWAVGEGNSQTLTIHWDGSSWSIVSSPNDGTGSNTLYGVAAINTNDVWAVGQGSSGTLTEQYAPAPSPSPTPSPSLSPSPTITQTVTPPVPVPTPPPQVQNCAVNNVQEQTCARQITGKSGADLGAYLINLLNDEQDGLKCLVAIRAAPQIPYALLVVIASDQDCVNTIAKGTIYQGYYLVLCIYNAACRSHLIHHPLGL